MKGLIFSKGMPEPLGASVQGDALNFALYSTTAKTVFIHIFASANDEEPIIKQKLDSSFNKTQNIWHISIEGLNLACLYECPSQDSNPVYYLF